MLLIVGILSIGYFAAYAMFAGLTNTFTYFWLVAGVMCILAGIVPRWLKKLNKPIPKKITDEVKTLSLLMFVLVAIVEGFIIYWGFSEPDDNADYMIVLGAQVIGKEPSYNLTQRLDAAYDYLVENPETIVVLSGGQGVGEEISEAQAMAEYLEKKGISKERMKLEAKSVNTFENIENSKKLIEKDKSVVIVTNNFHVWRGVQCAKVQGIENVQGLGAPIKGYTVPNLYFREFFAVMKYFYDGKM